MLIRGPLRQRVLAAMCLVCGLGSVAPLLAWVFGLGSFAAWYWLQAVPMLLLVVISAFVLKHRRALPDLQIALAAGAWGGLAGTVLYDVVRMPLLAFGYHLFAPINAYGILMINGSHSTPLTDFLGWSYNFENGVLFGVAFGIVALGRRWWWAVPFALLLETTTVVTPYADYFGLRGHLDLVLIAYGAHIFYAFGLGTIVRAARSWSVTRLVPFRWAAGGLAVILLLGQVPETLSGRFRDASAVDAQTSVVRAGVFVPEWIRIPSGQCFRLVNRDGRPYHLTIAKRQIPALPEPMLPPYGRRRYCIAGTGIVRVQLDAVPYSGGFVLLDPAA